MNDHLLQKVASELDALRQKSNLRVLPNLVHQGDEVLLEGRRMLNLSSNDYLGLGVDESLREEFFAVSNVSDMLFSSSSSRLLTGNYAVYDELEKKLCSLYQSEGALVFNSGYHANIGILSAVCDSDTLILADKLVHASVIDGIRLSSAKCIRYRHNHLGQLSTLLERYHACYSRVIVVTESLFSMDGDECDLLQLVSLKKRYDNVLLYVDEAHALGVRGAKGLGCAEEVAVLSEIDFLVGTFGKALASVGAFVVCNGLYRELLVNKMRSFIFTTALPPINVMWTIFLLEKLPSLTAQREQLSLVSARFREALRAKGYECPSTSHIVPLMMGESSAAMAKAEELQRQGFYALPVRPPTVPEGSSRIRFSLSAHLTIGDVDRLVACLGQ